MANIFSKFKDRVSVRDDFPEEFSEDYVELGIDAAAHKKAKITVRPFTIDDFADIKPVLDALRDGYTVALVNIRQLKEKDIIELKRAVNKLKKTCDAIDGDIAGFGEDWIVVTPSFASVHRDERMDDLTPE